MGGIGQADRLSPERVACGGVGKTLPTSVWRKNRIAGEYLVWWPAPRLLCAPQGHKPRLTGMARGPAPTPKHILSLRGSKEAKYREELGTPASAMPEPPEWLRPAAKEMFRLVCGYTARMGTLAESDTEVICRYAIIWDRWREAEMNLAKMDSGWIEVLAPDGSLRFSRPNRWQSQANSCHEQLRQLETVLGLTPADRTRLGYGAVKVVQDPVDALFDDTATG